MHKVTFEGALLFVPAVERRLAKLPSLDADALIVDLEDAIHPGAKAEARALLAAALGSLERRAPLLVRINPLHEGGASDLAALAGLPVDGVMVPKAELAQVVAVAAVLGTHWEPDAAPALVPLVESAAGVVGLPRLLGESARGSLAVAAVALGGEDLAADLGVTRTAGGAEIQLARQTVVMQARAAGVGAIDTPVLDSRDADALRADTRLAAGLGFDGKLCIHPAQVSVVREAFAPAPDQLRWAEETVAAAKHLESTGTGVGAVDGRMIDRPIVTQAERLLRRRR
jgi:citrate lyase subunit beta/citryl-CoA lyase